MEDGRKFNMNNPENDDAFFALCVETASESGAQLKEVNSVTALPIGSSPRSKKSKK